MGRVRSNSSPELLPSTRDLMHQDCAHLEGLSTNVKLLMKLLHDATEEDDGRNPQRVAGMMAILDDVKARIEKSQLPKRPRIHPCNSDSRRNGGAPPTTRVKPQDPIAEENHQLRRELSASITAQKSLMRMFASLGKEKEDMASELARRVQELNDVEQLVRDLRAQNEKLAEKVKACMAEHGGEKAKLRSKTLMVAGIDRIRGGFGRISRGEEGMIKEVGEMIVSM